LVKKVCRTGREDIEPYSINKENSNEIYGVLPYVAPEILQGKPLTESVDIYSFGMIMWTLSAGVLPWCNRPHDSNLASQICSGLRPEIRTPNVYTQLMTRCWDSDPSSRPTTSELNDELETCWAIIIAMAHDLFNILYGEGQFGTRAQ
ncbi:20010_t:CDS:2, partial [Funneliformis geosporum]